MRKLTEVEEARALMTEAVGWSVMKWLTEKKRVRKAADKANAVLWAMQKEAKARWSENLQAVYAELAERDGNGRSKPKPNAVLVVKDELRLLAKRVKQADEAADRAHQDAEETFSKAEKILSTSLAREGCRKAIASWDLYEKAITAAETGVVSRTGK